MTKQTVLGWIFHAVFLWVDPAKPEMIIRYKNILALFFPQPISPVDGAPKFKQLEGDALTPLFPPYFAICLSRCMNIKI